MATAETAVSAFVANDDPATWWQRLEPLLTPAARNAYSTVDPTNIAGDTVLASGDLVDDSSAYLAGVRVPTDAGDYEVLLQRTAAADPWLVERIRLDAR